LVPLNVTITTNFNC